MKEDEDDVNPTLPETSGQEMSEAEIDANMEGTFPASDPPSWTLGSDHHAATDQERDEE